MKEDDTMLLKWAQQFKTQGTTVKKIGKLLDQKWEHVACMGMARLINFISSESLSFSSCIMFFLE